MCFLSAGKRVRNTLGLPLSETADCNIYESLPVPYNSPHEVASYYVEAVSEQGSCPVELITNLGTENGLAASIQTFVRDNPDTNRYVSSPINQRIERWWSFCSRRHCTWWMSFFNELEFQGTVDTSCDMAMECLWYCFHGVLQADFDAVKESWNTHSICKSKNNLCLGGLIPFSFCASSMEHRIIGMPVNLTEVRHVTQHIIEDDNSQTNDLYQDYFNYARRSLSIHLPENWEKALSL